MSRISASDHLSVTFGALADPTRRAILARLAAGEASVTELAEPFALSLPGVSKHLKVLQRAGLITQGRNAQWRPCRLEAPRLKEVSEWVGEYRRFWDESFERLDEYLEQLKREKESNGRQEDGR
jgi:DNA-binding transcriptional ArsR family regulator